MTVNLRNLILGAPKSPLDPKVFEKLALVALLAWVGLGADGLSSSCYGPEEIFLNLGPYRALAPFLIVAIAFTTAVLSAAYANTIEAFPGGGGGYIVASKGLGRYPGLLCGCALLLDYILTIAISMSSGLDALFSALPHNAQAFKLPATILATVGLMLLNLRGVKESILILMPIFLGFLVTHAIAITAAIVMHGSGTAAAVTQSVDTARSIATTLGPMALLAILLKAYTVGAGTYTGIEAVSNSVPILREPKVATAKRTMLYMAVSLALTSGGLLLGYLLYNVQSRPGMTLNASFFNDLFGSSPLARGFIAFTLMTEGALLFVAAQAGYVDGPRVMASMAVDSWVPRWFRRLSDRLVISNGVLLIGTSAIAAILLTGGSVKVLVILYAFSVFVTFLLSQLGMCVTMLRDRDHGWKRRIAVNATAALVSAGMVAAMAVLHFGDGVWVALAIIVVLTGLCIFIRSHYAHIGRLLRRLEPVRRQVEQEPAPTHAAASHDPTAPTAAVLVRGYNGPGIHTLLTILRIFPNYFRNFVFISVGDIDFDRFKGTKEVERLRESVEGELEKYAALARKWGYAATHRYALGVDVVDEVARLCPSIIQEYPRTLFFAGQLIFEQPTIVTRFLHEQTAEEIQRRLQFQGLTLIPLPIRVLENTPAV